MLRRQAQTFRGVQVNADVPPVLLWYLRPNIPVTDCLEEAVRRAHREMAQFVKRHLNRESA